MSANEELDKGLLPLRVIWSAMLMSLFIYLFVGLYVRDKLPGPIEEDAFNILRAVLYVVSLITLIATRYIRKLVLSRKSHSRQSSQAFRNPALGRYWTATIVSLAMSESIGTYGLILYFLGKNQIDLYLLILVSAAAVIMYRPKRDEVISLAQDGPEDSDIGKVVP